MRTIITNAGISAAINAGLNGPRIKVNKVKIGNQIIVPTAQMTDVTGDVGQEFDSSYIQYQVIDDRTFLFKITLDESVGDFDIGNIGLFLEDGTMFTITALTKVEEKIKNNGETVGNRRVFEIPIVLSGLSGLIDVTILVPDEASIPFVANENSLPEASLAPYSVYEVVFHTGYRCSCLALRTSSGWSFVQPQAAEQGGSFYEGYFADGISVGDLVYWNGAQHLFMKADGLDNSKGYLGIRGSLNNVVNTGVYIKEGWNLNPGTRYYANGGQYAGLLTTVPNNYFVGIAIDSNTMYLGTLAETIDNKVTSINTTTPSNVKYPSESAIVELVMGQLEGYAKTDMSNVHDVTFTGSIHFDQVIEGTARKALWDT